MFKLNVLFLKTVKNQLYTGTVLEKMIERCGKDSPLPVVMANDALFAGKYFYIRIYYLHDYLNKGEK